MLRALLLSLFVVACASSSEGGGAWVAAEATGGVRFGQPYPTLVFEGSRVSGTGGCNRYTGEVSRSGSSFDIRNLTSTEMACPPRVMEQETLFFTLLGDAIAADEGQPGVMVLRTADGRMLRLRSAPPQ